MVLALEPPIMFFAFFLPVENFCQRISLIREVRITETKENSLRRLNNNVIIKHSQGRTSSSFSRAIDNILSHIL